MNQNWCYKKIGDVCTVERGGSPRPIDDYITDDPNGINWIKIGDTSESMYITQTAQKIRSDGIKKSRYVQPGDFLLSNSMSFGRPYILKIDGCIHDGWLVLRDNNDLFDKRFLYYYLCAKPTYEKFKLMAVGGVVNNLNSEMVRCVEVPIPDKNEQVHIANILDKINDVIGYRKKQLEAFDILIKSQFIEMFGDVSTGDYHYETRKLGEVANVGSSHRVFTTEFVESGIPFYRGTEIGELAAGQKPSKPFYITEDHYKELACDDTKPQKGDLLMPSICNKGQVWMVDSDDPFYYKDGRVLSISANREIFDTKYLEYFMREKTLIEYPKMGSGTTFAEFKIFMLKDMDVLVPPRSKQEEFSAFIKQTDKSKFIVQQALNKTQQLYDSLMQQYFG